MSDRPIQPPPAPGSQPPVRDTNIRETTIVRDTAPPVRSTGFVPAILVVVGLVIVALLLWTYMGGNTPVATDPAPGTTNNVTIEAPATPEPATTAPGTTAPDVPAPDAAAPDAPAPAEPAAPAPAN